MTRFFLTFFFLFLGTSLLFSQSDSTLIKKLTFTGDFRFRIEQDWNSRKSDATYGDIRSRLGNRFRFGMIINSLSGQNLACE